MGEAAEVLTEEVDEVVVLIMEGATATATDTTTTTAIEVEEDMACRVEPLSRLLSRANWVHH